MKLAIVLLNWNGKSLLEQFLPSVVTHNSHNTDIYIADNASTDDSLHFVEKNYPEVKIVKNKGNLGYAGGYNAALQEIDADVFGLVNSDIEVTPNWLAPIFDAFLNEEKLAVAQPKILAYHNKNHFEYAGACGGFLDFFGYPFCRGRILNTVEEDKGQYNNKTNIFWASGACFFIRKSIFEAFHGFDADYFSHQEEIDLCWRIQNENYHIKAIPKSVVYHVGGATLEQANPKKTYLNFRNNLITILKNAPKNKTILIITARLLLDGLAGLRFLFRLEPVHTWAIIKAHFAFYAQIPKVLNKRKQQKNKTSNFYYTKSVIWQYFINQKKAFSQLKKTVR
ncbi:MAG: dTDP-Rha--alpha-D-GlcNAc-pyrophosphate polyprenol alpha-3-L-rhamnosyltransferase [Flavobacteriales bacterium]|nr:MAG: dTDP-Rha--alpha-D-GlcNAc-pyrophosphate polyprenol alpha-3-L-rhamnosyltransferase [Flavobacteriales bacterium]